MIRDSFSREICYCFKMIFGYETHSVRYGVLFFVIYEDNVYTNPKNLVNIGSDSEQSKQC